MQGFLTSSACHGRRPSHLASRRHYPRPNLIARLLRERQVTRFIIAPEGFGKTGLAMEYCNTVFSFEHTFWINGRSPCFLRDLDRGVLASSLAALDHQPFLVVIDDVPLLETERAENLSSECDKLLNQGCEVLATCTPACDAFSSLQTDRLKLGALDLLLSDVEMDAVRTTDDRLAQPTASIPACGRVAVLCWNSINGESAFLSGITREEMPAEMLLAVFTMLVLEGGFLSDVAVFGPCGGDMTALLDEDYPYLGINRQAECFETPSFSVEHLSQTFGAKIEAMALCSCFAGRNALVMRWADLLLVRKKSMRACELVKALCSRIARAEWLAQQSGTLLKQGQFIGAHGIYESLGSSPFVFQSSLEVGEALRLVAMGKVEGAVSRAHQLMADLAVSQDARALAGMVVMRYGSSSKRKKARQELMCLVDREKGAMMSRDYDGKAGAISESFWLPLAQTCLVLVRDSWQDEQGALKEYFDQADDDARILIATEILCAFMEASKEHGAKKEEPPVLLVEMEAYVRQRLKNASATGGDIYVSAAGLALQKAREKGLLSDNQPLRAMETLALHQAEMDIFTQRRAFDVRSREKNERRAERVLTHPDAYLDGRYLPEKATLPSIVPLLSVNLFGGLSVSLGDTPVDGKRLSRRKVKTLLALLVLHRGREISRDRLLGMLWPDSAPDTARKNFYSVWSQLRTALSGPTGSCPYLVRHQSGCSLDDRLLITDIARFDAVCRMLLFGQPGAEGWAQLYAEIDEGFADDLLPVEVDNDIVNQARRDCRMKLVDALVAAANRLVALNDAQQGLWFARAALQRDRTREDAYVALMQAQIAADQRTAALETYFACRQVLTNELGIDPSLKIIALYRSIIETEEPMD